MRAEFFSFSPSSGPLDLVAHPKRPQKREGDQGRRRRPWSPFLGAFWVGYKVQGPGTRRKRKEFCPHYPLFHWTILFFLSYIYFSPLFYHFLAYFHDFSEKRDNADFDIEVCVVNAVLSPKSALSTQYFGCPKSALYNADFGRSTCADNADSNPLPAHKCSINYSHKAPKHPI